MQTPQEIEVHEAEVYVSSPSNFWYRVKPIGRKPSKTLILRSSIFTRRFRGGRSNRNCGTTDYATETKQAFYFETAFVLQFGIVLQTQGGLHHESST